MSDPLLELDSLSKHFDGVQAVDRLSLSLESHRTYGLIGPNGAGKTTAMHCISGVLKPTSGDIWFRGDRITELPSHKIATLGLSRTFQEVKLFDSMTVIENLIVALYDSMPLYQRVLPTRLRGVLMRSEQYDAVERVVQQLELESFLDLHPHELPFGVKRRVELARVMIRDTDLILLDEPAAGLNPEESRELVGTLQMLKDEGYTSVVIDHDMRFIMDLCDYIFVMNQGEKIAEGPPDEIKQNSRVINVYLGE